MIIVPPYGPVTSRIMFIGEAPGKSEAFKKPRPRPFIGKSGRLMANILACRGISINDCYLDNIVPLYLDGNPDPTPELISRYTPRLIDQIRSVNPEIIVAVGRFAMRWFLGESSSFDLCHGLPFHAGHFDPTRANRAPQDAVIIPVHHPAEGFYNGKQRRVIAYDFDQVAFYIKGVKPLQVPIDKYLGQEDYRDCTGEEIESMIMDNFFNISRMAIDTEGNPKNPWSIQFSWQEGTGYTLRCVQSDFLRGLHAFETWAIQSSEVLKNPIVVTHCASTPKGTGYELQMARKMGINLSRINLRDTMRNLYLLIGEAKGLKDACYRFAGMHMEEYQLDRMKKGAADKQLEWFGKCLDLDIPQAPKIPELQPDGTIKEKQPQRVSTLVKRLFTDYGKNLDLDLSARYDNWIPFYKEQIENHLGQFPEPSLDDIPLEEAYYYACRDADGTLRIDQPILDALARFDSQDKDKQFWSCTNLENVDRGRYLLPLWEEMQDKGLPVSKSRLSDLASRMDTIADEYKQKIIATGLVTSGFNPNSPDQTSNLLSIMIRKGLIPGNLPRTEKGNISTEKDAIEHLRYDNEIIDDLFRFREHDHISSGFCRALLKVTSDKSTDIEFINSNLDPAKTTSQRLSSSEPNLLNIPSVSEIGKEVRKCFMAPDGYVFISCDYSGLELRIMAEESKDPVLCDLFRKGINPHKNYAEYYFKREIAKDTPQYYFGKQMNFSVGFGMSAESIYRELHNQNQKGFTLQDCELAKQDWWNRYAGVAAYKRALVADAKKRGYVRDKSGHIRYVYNLHSDNGAEVSAAERETVSHRIQGTAQYYIQNAMIHLRDFFYDLHRRNIPAWLLLQVHDELLTLAKEEDAEWIGKEISNTMIQYSGASSFLEYKTDISIGKNWGEL